MIRPITGAFFFLVVFLISCTNDREPDNTREVDPDAIFFDYRVTGEEQSDQITVLLQFRYADEYGGTLLLEKPSKVEVDGEEVRGDSSRVTGPFYEMQKPVDWLKQTHQVVFTDDRKKQYRQNFHFDPVALLTDLPDTIHRGELEFEFSGLDPRDEIRVVMTDTSFTGNGVNRVDTVKTGKLFLGISDLNELANGPIQLEFVRESEQPVMKGQFKRGRIVFSYSIKREFILADEAVK